VLPSCSGLKMAAECCANPLDSSRHKEVMSLRIALFGLRLFVTCFDFRSPFISVKESSKSVSEVFAGRSVSAAYQTFRCDVCSSLSGTVGHFLSSCCEASWLGLCWPFWARRSYRSVVSVFVCLFERRILILLLDLISLGGPR